ncbi:alanine--glyoxylate aminotransferase family protein [Candidatus Bathyarchaeota archaeon]|nr:MAG: alanine--glyoxylate aminotransferase family protein [Candidatus Bathyarchaeota archaeon]
MGYDVSETQKLLMLPGPTNVPPRVSRAMLKPLIGHRGPEFKQLHSDVLEKTKRVFETKGDVFILTSSGTGATECALQNTVDDGDKVVVTENGFFSERLTEAIRAYGGSPIVLRAPWGRTPKIDDFKKILKDNPDTKVLAVVYNETSTGATIRCLKELGELCARQDLLLMVDAISILGGDELPVDRWNVDVCVTASQKCLMCPPGLAFVSVSSKAWDKIQKKKTRRSYYFDLPMWKKYREEGFTPFTPSVPLFYALNEACDMILEEGLPRRFERHKVCAQAVYDSTEAMGLGIYAEKESRSYTVATIESPPGIDEGKVRELVRTKYGISLGGSLGEAKGKVFRVGVMGNVGSPEIMTTISAIGSATAELGFKVRISDGLEAARLTLARLPGRVN